jgi:hypothetical protein
MNGHVLLQKDFPNFAIPAQYGTWRDSCLKEGIQRIEISQALEAMGDEFALLRAAQIISVDPPHQSEAHRLAGQLMQSERVVLRWFGRYISTFLVMRGSYCNDLEASIPVEATVHTLHDLLLRLEHHNHDLLSLELEMNIHLSLAESYSITEDFEPMFVHASKLVTLTPSVGLKNFSFSGKMLLARALLYKGNASSAIEVYKTLNTDELFSRFRFNTDIDLAIALFWSGDFLNVSQTLQPHVDGSLGSSELVEAAKNLLVMTLFHTFQKIAFEQLPNRASVIGQAHLALHNALQTSPLEDSRKAMFREARNQIAHTIYNQNTWLTSFERSFATLCSLRAGDYGVALRSLPKLDTHHQQPLWPEALSHFVTLETALRIPFATGKNSLYEKSILSIQTLLERTSPLALQRILPTLQLLTPYALAFIAGLGGIDEIVVQAGMNCIINLKMRPANVYGATGLRPVQIVEMTLEAFGIGQLGETKAGGGQTEGLRISLYRTFGETAYWFEPVLPSRLIVGLIEAAHVVTLPEWLREACQRAAFSVGRSFGMMPVLQKVSAPRVLTALEEEITRALYGNLDASRIWQTVQTYGGSV